MKRLIPGKKLKGFGSSGETCWGAYQPIGSALSSALRGDARPIPAALGRVAARMQAKQSELTGLIRRTLEQLLSGPPNPRRPWVLDVGCRMHRGMGSLSVQQPMAAQPIRNVLRF